MLGGTLTTVLVPTALRNALPIGTNSGTFVERNRKQRARLYRSQRAYRRCHAHVQGAYRLAACKIVVVVLHKARDHLSRPENIEAHGSS